MTVLKIEHEVLTVFCKKCTCCLANGTHCATCHTKKSIKTLCGCGNCLGKAQDYLERETMRQTRLSADRAAKALVNV